MNTNIKTLLTFQDLDREIISLKKMLGAIPQEIEKIEKNLQEWHDKISNKKKDIEMFLKQRKELELDIDSQNTKLKKLNEQLYTLKDNKEYQAMLKEINDIKQSSEKLEEKILENMYNYDKEREEYKKIEKELKDCENVNKQEKDEKNKEVTRLKEMLDQKLSIRRELLNLIDKKELSVYERVLENKGDFAIVEIKRDVCQGCHMSIPPQMVNDLILCKDEISRCPHCARIIYFNRENLHNNN